MSKTMFPSVSELLSSPMIKPFTDRMNPSSVMGAARSVIDEITQEATHVTQERRLPDVSDLTYRIVKRLKEMDSQEPKPSAVVASSENLKSRAERLIPQLQANPCVESAAAEEFNSTLWIRVVPKKKTVFELADSLHKAVPSIAVACDQNSVLFDLRSFPAKWDIDFIDAF